MKYILSLFFTFISLHICANDPLKDFKLNLLGYVRPENIEVTEEGFLITHPYYLGCFYYTDKVQFVGEGLYKVIGEARCPLCDCLLHPGQECPPYN